MTHGHWRAANPSSPGDDSHLTARTLDGSYNDHSDPAMGAVGARFGRSVPVARTRPEPEPAILTPNPRTVSRELLTRESFIPATTLNVLAGAWLQFEVHDWFSHGKNEEGNPWQVQIEGDDPWSERPMRIQRTRRDPTQTGDGPPTFVTAGHQEAVSSEGHRLDSHSAGPGSTAYAGWRRGRVGTVHLLPRRARGAWEGVWGLAPSEPVSQRQSTVRETR